MHTIKNENNLSTGKNIFYHYILLLLIFFTALPHWGCNNSSNGIHSNENEPGGNGASISTIENNNYAGTASVTIDYYEYDYIGNLIFIEQKTYSHHMEVYAGAAKEVGSIVEDNPFNLQISTNTMGSEGTFGLSSAILNVSLSGGSVLLEYWDLKISGARLEGTLTDTHTAEAAAANHFYAWENMAGFKTTYLFVMDKGTTLSGTISNEQVDIEIKGQSTDRTRIFTINLKADILL